LTAKGQSVVHEISPLFFYRERGQGEKRTVHPGTAFPEKVGFAHWKAEEENAVVFTIEKCRKSEISKATSGTLIPADPPCANLQFATMEGRELTCGDFHAGAAFPPPQVCSRRSSLYAFAASAAAPGKAWHPRSLTARRMPPCGFCFM